MTINLEWKFFWIQNGQLFIHSFKSFQIMLKILALYQNATFLFVIHSREVEGEEGGKADRPTGLIAKRKVLLTLGRNTPKRPEAFTLWKEQKMDHHLFFLTSFSK